VPARSDETDVRVVRELRGALAREENQMIF
jgi:hypothetical protein